MSKQPNPSGIPEDDIINPKLNVSCLDFLLIELVPLAQRITDQLHAREQALIEEFRRSKILNNSENASSTIQPTPVAPATGTSAAATSATGAVTNTTATHVDNDETREALFWRLDGLGYRVGQGLVER